MGWKHTAYHIVNSDPGYKRSKQQLYKTLKITFASLSKSNDEKEKEKKERKAIAKRYALHANAKKKGNCKALCVTRKRSNSIYPQTQNYHEEL